MQRPDHARWQPLPRVTFPVRDWSMLFPLLAGAVVYLRLVTAGAALLNDPDTFWHLAIGQWIIDHRAFPYDDPFSYTFHGARWVPGEWLSDVIFTFAYRWFGWGGVIATASFAAAAAFGLLMRALASWLGERRAVIGVTVAFLLSVGHLLARPHVLALVPMTCWIAALVAARAAGKRPSFVLLPLMVLWANLHGSFIVGLAFAALLGSEAVFEAPAVSRLGIAKAWGGFFAAAACAALLTPNGVSAFQPSFELTRMPFALSMINEWRSPDFHHFQPLELWLLAVIFAGLSLGLKLPATRTLMLLLLVHFALNQLREGELLGIVGTLLVAPALAKALPQDGEDNQQPARLRARLAGATVAASAPLILLALWSTASSLNARGVHPGEAVAPASAFAAVEAAGVAGNVLNAYEFGGYFMFRGTPVFIDGRGFIYGDDFVYHYAMAAAAVGDELPTLLDRYSIAWTMLQPRSAAATLLDHLPGWQRLYADDFAVVHVRRHSAQ